MMYGKQVYVGSSYVKLFSIMPETCRPIQYKAVYNKATHSLIFVPWVVATFNHVGGPFNLDKYLHRECQNNPIFSI